MSPSPMSAAVGLLKGVAGTGVFVLAAQFPAVRSAMAYATGADKMPHGVVTNPHIFVSIDKDGIVTIVAHPPKWVTAPRAPLCR